MAGSIKKALDSALKQALALAPEFRKQKRRVGRLCDTLLGFSPEERKAVLRDGRLRQFRSRMVVEELLRRVRRAWFESPARADALGDVAWQVLSVTGRSLENTLGPRGWKDTSSRLWAYRGNVARILCQWEEAHQCFRRAYLSLERGSGDVLLKAEVLSLHASLLRDRKHFEGALACLAEAKGICGNLKDRNLQAKVLLKEASVFHVLGQLEYALEVQFQACKLLDSEASAELAAAAWGNLAEMFFRLGNSQMAAQILDECSDVFHRCGPQSTVQLTRSWVRGLIASSQGKFGEAEGRLELTLEGYQKLGIAYERALVSLDLAAIYAAQGRQDDLAVLVDASWAELQKQNLHEEAAQALQLLVTAAHQRQVEEEVLKTAREALRQHRFRPRSCSP